MIGSNQKPFIDSFDVVVRMNGVNRYWPFSEALANDLGTRLDILYTHQLLIDRQTEKYGEFVKPEGSKIRLKTDIPHIGMLKDLIDAPPTVGMSAIWDLCLHPIKNLYVTGFTFCLNGPDDHIFIAHHKPIYNENTKHFYPGEALAFRHLYNMTFLQVGADLRLSQIARL